MGKILVVVESSGGALEDTAFELLSAARGLSDATVGAVLMGEDLGAPTAELVRWFDEVHVFDDSRLARPDGDFQARILATLLRREAPFATLVPHTNTGMELAPMLAARVDAPLITDAVAMEVVGDRVRAVRTVFAGKVQARVSAASGPCGVLLSVRPGAFTPAERTLQASGTVRSEAVPDDVSPRRRFVKTVAPDPSAVDISQAAILVAVGRGIEDEENLEEIRSLAEAMGAEVACTRPVVDKKWLEKSRQVGTSGVSVKPSVYLALGISGSFQHMGGIKGGPFIAAINKDPAAPIFDVADVGVVGDILDLVPLLEEKIRERKA